jgi:ribosomal protein S18 acetylase RimI-like enzyme
METTSTLDDPIGAGLRSAHANLAEQNGGAIRYRPDVSPFCSIGVAPSDESWSQLRELTGGAQAVLFMESGFAVASDWRVDRRIPLAQMVYRGTELPPARAELALRNLSDSDVPEMLRLTELTQPGPFSRSTIEFGGYVGIFDGRSLVAMAGRRMKPPGFVEVSAVCTDPNYRGRGYARAVMEEVMRAILAAGSTPFLHVADGNPASRLYEEMGFTTHQSRDVLVLAAATV